MTRKDQRRGASVRAALLHDPLRKLAAIALGYLLWVFIDNQISSAHTFEVPVVVGGSDQPDSGGARASRLLIPVPTGDVAVVRIVGSDGEERRDVRITAHGPRFLIDSLRNAPLQLTVGQLAIDWTKAQSVEVTVADIQPDALTTKDVRLAMEPPRLRLDIEHMRDQEDELRLDRIDLVCDDKLRARLRPHLAEFSRSRVRVVGQAHDLAAFRASTERPFVARLEARENERHVTAEIRMAPALARLRLQDPTTVTIPLLPVRQEFALELPLTIDDLALPAALQGLYHPDGRTRTVRIKAGGELLTNLITLGDGERQRWAREHLRLHVWLPTRDDEHAYGQEIVVQARLQLVGPLLDRVDAVDYALAEAVTVPLRRQP